MKTIEELKQANCIVFECISGSRAYGLATPTSDTDIKGVFVLPQEQYYSLDYVGQINNETNDIVYYELKKFIELCVKNNPNIIELLYTPKDCIIYKDPLFDLIKSELFLSKLCKSTFSNYAFTQIKKSRGLNKKMMNPMEKKRKEVKDFCVIRVGKKSISLNQFLLENNYKQEKLGLAKISNIKDSYNLFYSDTIAYNGVFNKGANEVCLSSIPKEEQPVGMLYFNTDGYSSYCKKYREYWDWVQKRNEERYKNNKSHDKNYDTKNMMHTFRLLHLAREISKNTLDSVRVTEEERLYLLNIKKGMFQYHDLLTKATQIKDELESVFEKSSLMDVPNRLEVNKLLVDIRSKFYQRKG